MRQVTGTSRPMSGTRGPLRPNEDTLSAAKTRSSTPAGLELSFLATSSSCITESNTMEHHGGVEIKGDMESGASNRGSPHQPALRPDSLFFWVET